MECFAKTINCFERFTISENISILDVWQGSEYASANTFEVKRVFIKKITTFSFYFPDALWILRYCILQIRRNSAVYLPVVLPPNDHQFDCDCKCFIYLQIINLIYWVFNKEKVVCKKIFFGNVIMINNDFLNKVKLHLQLRPLENRNLWNGQA